MSCPPSTASSIMDQWCLSISCSLVLSQSQEVACHWQRTRVYQPRLLNTHTGIHKPNIDIRCIVFRTHNETFVRSLWSFTLKEILAAASVRESLKPDWNADIEFFPTALTASLVMWWIMEALDMLYVGVL